MQRVAKDSKRCTKISCIFYFCLIPEQAGNLYGSSHLLGEPKTLSPISTESDIVRRVSQLYSFRIPRQRRDISKRVILKPCGFSDILFAHKLPKAISPGF